MGVARLSWALIVPAAALILSGCSAPLKRDCKKTFVNMLPVVHSSATFEMSKLVFDYSASDAAKSAKILKSGYAGSGPPAFGMSSTGRISNAAISNAQPSTIILSEKLIVVAGPGGTTDNIIQQACNLESEGVTLKTISYLNDTPKRVNAKAVEE